MPRGKRRGRPLDGLLLVDKPGGETSNRTLQRVKRLYGAAKAGHTGTLDPLATGMLPVMFGEATKLGAWLIDADKAYETVLVLGRTTDTLDADGRTLEERPVPAGIDAAAVDAALEPLRGEILQVPPMVSAIRVDGRRLHEIARAGGHVEREPRRVTLHEIRVLDVDGPRVRLHVRCSKGTYVRSLVDDLGRLLGCGAHVGTLRRCWVAPFEGAAMHGVDALEALGSPGSPAEPGGHGALDALLLPMDAGLGHLPEVVLDADGVERFRHGNPAAVPAGTMVPIATAMLVTWRVRAPDGALLGLGEPVPADAPGGPAVRPVRVLVSPEARSDALLH